MPDDVQNFGYAEEGGEFGSELGGEFGGELEAGEGLGGEFDLGVEAPEFDDLEFDAAGKKEKGAAVAGPGLRFLGGRERRAEYQGHLWYRLFLGTVLLSVVLIVLFGVLWLLFRPSYEPALFVLGVTDYESPLIPPLRFARNDLDRIESTPRAHQPAGRFLDDAPSRQTQQGFEQFLQNSLQRVEGDEVAVIYIAAHAASDQSGGYLLHSEVLPDQPSSGLSVATMLTQIAACPARNKIVLLNVSSLRASLPFGMLGNDFVATLRKEFAELQERLQSDAAGGRQNIWILCSADEGQQSFASTEFRHSLFGAAAAYCLHGGPGADRRDERNRTDNIISASEMIRFISDAVSSWSLRYRNEAQLPQLLHIGNDFPVLDVDHRLVTERFFAGVKPLRDLGEADEKEQSLVSSPETEAEKQAAQEAAAAEADPTRNPARKSLSTDSLTERLNGYWQAAGNLRNSPRVLQYPRQRLALAMNLRRAESHLLAGRLEAAAQVLDGPVESLSARLSGGESLPAPAPWSLMTYNPENKEDPLSPQAALIERVLANPVADDVALLNDSPLVEAALLRLLAQSLLRNGAWQDPAAIRTAVEVRTLAETAAQFPSPRLLPLVQADLEQADTRYRDGIRSLLLGRSREAIVQLTAARQFYLQIRRQLADLQRQLVAVESLTADGVSLMEWLERVPLTWPKRRLLLRRVDDFYEQLQAFRLQPARSVLQSLAQQAGEIELEALSACREANERRDVAAAEAALALTFLPAATRAELLQTILQSRDRSPLVPSMRRRAEDTAPRPACGYPLRNFLAMLRPSGGLATMFQPFDPASPTGVTLQELAAQEKLRHERARLGTEIRRLWYNAANAALEEPPGETIWQQWIQLLVQTPLQETSLPALRFRDPLAANYERRFLADLYRWQIARLDADQESVNLDYRKGARANFEAALRQLNPAYRDAQGPAPFALDASEFRLEGDQPVSIVLPIRTVLDLEDERPRLILDWFADRKQWDIALLEVAPATVDGGGSSIAATSSDASAGPSTATGAATRSQSAGRLEAPLDGLSPSRPLQVRLSIIPRDIDSQSPAPNVNAWIELANGSRYLLDLALVRSIHKQQPANLIASWTERAGRPNAVELYPNQQTPLEIRIQKNAPEALSLRLELSGGERKVSIPLDLPANQTGPIAVTPPEGMSLEIVNGRLSLGLFHGSELLEVQSLEVSVLDPLEFARPTVSYDPETRTVTATVQRLAGSDAPQPTAIGLEILGVPLQAGNVSGEIPLDAEAGTILAVVPEEVDHSSLKAAVSVSGVPRVFQYLVGAAFTSARERNGLGVNIVSPPSGSVFLSNSVSNEIDLRVQADGPDEIRLVAGIDANGNNMLDANEQQKEGVFWSGRDVRVRLATSSGEEPQFVIGSAVSDISLPFDAKGLLGPQQLIVSMFAGNQRVSETATLFFINAPPDVSIESPREGDIVAAGPPLTVDLTSSSPNFGAIHHIEIGVDRNANGKWDDDESLSPISPPPEVPVRFQDSRRTRLSLKSDALLPAPPQPPAGATPPAAPANGSPPPEPPAAPQEIRLMTRAVTHVIDQTVPEGTRVLVSPVSFRSFVLTPPTKSDAEPAPGSVAGVVRTVDGRPQRQMQVFIGDLAFAETDNEGRFTLTNIPPGEHVVVARSRDLRRVGSVKVTVESAQRATVAIPVRLQ